MTPLWRRAVKEALASKDQNARMFGEGLLTAFHCFDLSRVSDLVGATADELRGAKERDPDNLRGLALFDLGERIVFPADSFWLEWGATGLVLAGWKNGETSGVAALLIREWMSPAGREPIWSGLRPGVDQCVHIGHIVSGGGGRFGVAPPSADFASKYQPGELAQFEAIMFRALAALALINSPAAIAERQEVHKGLARDIRRAYPKAVETRASTILLRGLVLRGDGAGAGSASPKAYHFCRAHTRLKGGKVERVRAHWRGDPAFGVRIGSYSVRRDPPIDGAPA